MSDTTIKRVVLVGHCGFDSGSIRQAVRSAVGDDTSLEGVNDQQSLERVANAESLLLVNRALDGRFDAGTGVELIQSLVSRSEAQRPRMMLVSNYEDAQEEAVTAGAMQGFGKSQLHSDATRRRLREAVGVATNDEG